MHSFKGCLLSILLHLQCQVFAASIQDRLDTYFPDATWKGYPILFTALLWIALLFTAFITLELAYVVFKGLLSRNKPFLDVLRLQYGSLFEVFLRIAGLGVCTFIVAAGDEYTRLIAESSDMMQKRDEVLEAQEEQFWGIGGRLWQSYHALVHILFWTSTLYLILLLVNHYSGGACSRYWTAMRRRLPFSW